MAEGAGESEASVSVGLGASEAVAGALGLPVGEAVAPDGMVVLGIEIGELVAGALVIPIMAIRSAAVIPSPKSGLA